jgi:hypothetical protein
MVEPRAKEAKGFVFDLEESEPAVGDPVKNGEGTAHD